MIIRVDKCSTFGIKKVLTKSVQYLPKLLINNGLIPTIEMGESFKYLGRFFDFDMSDQEHKSELMSLIDELMSDIDYKALHPKNKVILYNRYVLSKISWHLTVAPLSKTWVTETINSVINQYIRKWLEIPISGTLSNIYLTHNKFGLNILPASVKFIQCQTVLRNALKTSPNDSIKELWKSTNNHINIQYDIHNSTKEVLKDFHSGQEDKLQHRLICQGSFFSNVAKISFSKLNTLWSAAQSKLPKNIFNFTVRYINNSLPTRKNLTRWGLASSPECSFCLCPETLLHVVAGCQSYLQRFTWRHDSILNFLAETFQTTNPCQLYADLSGHKSPSIITGDLYRPDLLLITPNEDLYVVELTVGSAKEVLKDFRSGHENKLLNQLTSQGSFFCSVTKFALPQLSKVWSVAQSKLPKNIYNFTIRYINNSLPTRKNLNRWAISSNSDCSFCLSPETLLHIVAGCQFYLDRFTWRHNSVLNFLAHQLETVDGSTLYADLNGFKSPSILTGDTYRPDLLLSCSNGSLYVAELTTGYETNLKNNVKRKKDKYRELLRQLGKNFNQVKFINLSISSLGIFAEECYTFLDMLDSIGLDKNHQMYCVRKMMTIAIRTTYYIFCCRNKEWENPDLLTI
ncbi:Hypothetical predicted protein [Paramuricea clavata]|uniref:Uncharacterized protein n=1 Tax=Paramuricea clavata TaxID=317549 RepID=A0A7D9L5I6_PARCT|nr:Hypothetical predicted protein [Paramuricea clavata]